MEHLIPAAWFTGLGWPLLLFITAVCFAILMRGADVLVEGASGIAYSAGMPKVIVGATIVSLGTTSPEAAVSVTAAWAGEPGLALGNAVGSIIADTGLIFGLGCLMTALPADRFVLDRQGWVQLASGVALAMVCYSAWFLQGDAAALSRPVGIGFLVALVAYLWVSVRWARVHPHGEPFVASEDFEEAQGMIVAHTHESHGLPVLIAMVLAGLVLVVISSQIVVNSVIELATQWGIPDVVVASTIVAFGTSLPELVVGISSVRKGHPELLVGNVIGADILNVLFVVGASAAAAPLPIVDSTPGVAFPEIFLYLHLPAMLLTLGMLRVFVASAVKRGTFLRWQGYPLLGVYVGYVVLQFIVS
jgi:cation:H+ antiporter